MTAEFYDFDSVKVKVIYWKRAIFFFIMMVRERYKVDLRLLPAVFGGLAGSIHCEIRYPGEGLS